MGRKWTQAQREKQAERIREWQPWKTGGVKTAEGKAKSAQNARKHGCYSQEVKYMREYLAECRAPLAEIKRALKC